MKTTTDCYLNNKMFLCVGKGNIVQTKGDTRTRADMHLQVRVIGPLCGTLE